jgi:RNA recognition motif-containing protein
MELVKIFVGGFPPETNELALVQLVSLYGEVDTIKIVRDKISKKSKGYAFLDMKTKADADAVLDNLDGSDFQGKELSIKFAVAKDEGPAHLKFNKYKRPDPAAFKAKRPRKMM